MRLHQSHTGLDIETLSNKAADLFKKKPFLFYLAPFAVLMIPWLVILVTGQAPYTYSYYSLHFLLDYSHGFVGRGLVGEVISWFVDTVTDRTQQIVLMLFAFILVVAASLGIGRVLRKTIDDKPRFRIALFFVLFLCLAEFVTGTYYFDIKMDKLIWALSLFSILLCVRPPFCFFVPVLTCIAMLINPVFVFLAFPQIVIIVVDQFKKRNFRVSYGVLALLVILSGLGVMFATLTLEPKLGFANAREFVDYYFRRSTITHTEEQYKIWEEWLYEYFPDSMQNLLGETFQQYFVTDGRGVTSILSTVFFAVPVFSIFTAFWIRVIKNELNKFQKFIFALCPLSLFATILGVVTSWDATKYYGYALFAQIILVLYFIAEHDPAFWATVEQYRERVKKSPLVAVSILAYATGFLLIF